MRMFGQNIPKELVFILIMIFSALHASERRIGVLVNPDFRGEHAFAYRIKSACKNIHWNADLLDVRNLEEFRKNSYDFVIHLTPETYKHQNCKNYLAIFHPAYHYFKKGGFLKRKYQHYDGYLLTYLPGANGTKKGDFENKLKFPHIRWYPTAQRREYRIVDPSHLFYICCAWGNRWEDEKFTQLLRLLDTESYMQLYGNQTFQSYYPKSYRGTVPYDEESLCKRIAQAGVALVLHSSQHNALALPSGRIFEAAEASAVIICDQNSFVQEHFGDSVFYINTDSDSLSIYSQIQHHMNWIGTNKIQALEKAKRAHEIYLEKFSLEDQLLQLEELHVRLSNKPTNFVWKWLEFFQHGCFK